MGRGLQIAIILGLDVDRFRDLAERYGVVPIGNGGREDGEGEDGGLDHFIPSASRMAYPIRSTTCGTTALPRHLRRSTLEGIP